MTNMGVQLGPTSSNNDNGNKSNNWANSARGNKGTEAVQLPVRKNDDMNKKACVDQNWAENDNASKDR